MDGGHRHWLALRRLGADRGGDYGDYLASQLRRTLSKRDNDPGVGARVLVDRVAAVTSSSGGSVVLCVGCRNGVELDEFRARGFDAVVGIDLFSQRRDIEVMDMHFMTFADDSFDIVYSSHSLEHSHDLPRALREIARVARDGALVAVEVPVRHRGSDADRVEFSGVEELREVLRPYLREELWVDEQPPYTDSNGQGSDVARIVFRVRKDAVARARPQSTGQRETVLGWLAATRPRAAGGLAVAITGLVFLFVVLPEWVGDRPYNVF